MRKLIDLLPPRSTTTPEEKEPAADSEPRNFERDVAEELTAYQESFRERAKNEQQRFALVTDSEFWVCLCFQTRAQAEEFGQKLGLPAGEKYVDGRKAAAKLGIEIQSPSPAFAPVRSIGKLPVETL